VNESDGFALHGGGVELRGNRRCGAAHFATAPLASNHRKPAASAPSDGADDEGDDATGGGSGGGAASTAAAAAAAAAAAVDEETAAALRTIPAEFFDSTFTLSDGASFTRHVVDATPERQETLNDHVDTVEVCLMRQISSQSESFFEALSNLQELREHVTAASAKVRAGSLPPAARCSPQYDGARFPSTRVLVSPNTMESFVATAFVGDGALASPNVCVSPKS
jgi:hypothetical protein